MYDVLFKCGQCGVHLSADAEDVGYEFLCPECDNILHVPAGDILFQCAHCSESLLGATAGIGESFTCPHCDKSVIVPGQGKAVPTGPEAELPVASGRPVDEPPAPASPSEPGADERQKNHMLEKWGGFIATAGLAEQEKQQEAAGSAETEEEE